jgi:hypothetical protein
MAVIFMIRFLFILALMPLFSGCKLLPGQDPLLVRAEQSIRFSYVAIDSFLKFEKDNREQYPFLKPVADKMRRHAPVILNQAVAAVKVYRASKAAQDADVVVQYLAVVENLTREAQAATAQLSTP